MKQFKPKPCKLCSTVFTPQAPCNLYCSSECAEQAFINGRPLRREKAYERWKQEQIVLGREHAIGVGKGGSQKKHKESPHYKNGIGFFMKIRASMKERIRYCERCSKDLLGVSNAGWAMHHKDHDRSNNEPENFELLCKRCHQIEHECWKNFDGATTIPEGSTPKQAEAPDTQTG